MGISLEDIFGNAQKAVEQGAEDFFKIGKHAALGYLENEAIKILEADKAKNESAFQGHIEDIMKRPTSTDSLGNYLSNQLQSPAIKTYGPWIILGILLIAGGAILLSKKG